MVQKVKLLKTFLLAFNSKKPAFISVEEKKSGTKESKSSWHKVRKLFLLLFFFEVARSKFSYHSNLLS